MRSTLALNGLGLYYNGTKSYLFANGTEIIKFKAKNSETVATILSRKHFKRLFIRQYEKDWIKWICL